MHGVNIPGASDFSLETRARSRFTGFIEAVEKVEGFHRRGKYDAAAAYAGLAALMAMRPHAGLFASPRLERVLTDIGRRTIAPGAWRRPEKVKIRRVLHVVSEILPVGGMTNNLLHWLQADCEREHSLAAIHHRHEIPEAIGAAIANSGGTIHRINRTIGHQVAWARKLRDIAQGHDAVVLHLYGQDPVAIIAFADPSQRPPTLLLNHADHLFWLGVSIADLVLNMRDAARDLTIRRRGAAAERNVVLPTVISPPARTRSREQAKRELGIAANAVLILSAARGMKYRSVDGVTFTSPHVELLKKHPEAELIVLGAGPRPEWRADINATGGRIRALPETPDTRVYFEAADIYVDSYPFVSSTSMMEAAGLGTPLVSRFYGPHEARIFAINHPGIDRPTLHAQSESEYIAHLERLIVDSAFRAAKGEEARQSVLDHHTAPGWLVFLERAYERAETLPAVDPASVFPADVTDTFQHGELDRSLYDIFGFAQDSPARLARGIVGMLPLGERLRAWRGLLDQGAFYHRRDAALRLLPHWLMRRLLTS